LRDADVTNRPAAQQDRLEEICARPVNPRDLRSTLPETLMRRTEEDIQNELLVLKAQEGDGDALKALVANWHSRFARLAWRLTNQREVASDVAQEAWVAIVRGLSKLDDPARFRPWAYRIVKNKCADWTRKRVTGREVLRTLEAESKRSSMVASEGSQEGTETIDEAKRLKETLETLPEDQRAILSLRYLEDMGITEIARVMEVPKGTIKSRLFYARDRLRQALERKE
jgi:RNA polymerase sigma factor (sigma-70 family)